MKKSPTRIWNLLSKRRPSWFEQNGSREIGAIDKPEDLWIVVAGGKGAKSAYLPGRTGTRLQTTAVSSRFQIVQVAHDITVNV